jgi:hypothetical protein
MTKKPNNTATNPIGSCSNEMFVVVTIKKENISYYIKFFHNTEATYFPTRLTNITKHSVVLFYLFAIKARLMWTFQLLLPSPESDVNVINENNIPDLK